MENCLLEDWQFKLGGAECEGVGLCELHTLCVLDNCRICSFSTKISFEM